jgi:exosortase N
VILPSWYLIKWITNFYSDKKYIRAYKPISLIHLVIINSTLLFLIGTAGFTKLKQHTVSPALLPQITLTGYTKEIVNNDILKFEKKGILIYIKPLPRFYGAEHNPMICWTGSGYLFTKINTKTVNGIEIYTGILKKANDTIYSAWWFGNGTYQTIKQAEWRWKMLKGDNFYLMNINSDNEELLYTEIDRLFKK